MGRRDPRGRGPAVVVLAVALGLAGCDGGGRGQAAAEFSRDGFARDPDGLRAMVGRTVEVRGFVDHGNLYGDAGVRAILGDSWSGAGPAPG